MVAAASVGSHSGGTRKWGREVLGLLWGGRARGGGGGGRPCQGACPEPATALPLGDGWGCVCPGEKRLWAVVGLGSFLVRKAVFIHLLLRLFMFLHPHKEKPKHLVSPSQLSWDAASSCLHLLNFSFVVVVVFSFPPGFTPSPLHFYFIFFSSFYF